MDLDRPEDGARDEGREALLEAASAPPAKKKRRWLLRLGLGIPLVLGLLVLLAPTLLSTGPVRRRIESGIREATGRKATLQGHGLGWWAPVTLSNFVLYERDGTTPLLKIRSLTLDVAHRPLLDGSVVLRTCDVAGVEVRIVRRKDGTLSTDELLQDIETASAAAPAPPPAAPAEEKPLRLTMGTVTLREVTAVYVDEASGTTARITGLTVQAKPGATPDEIVAAVAASVEAPGAPAGTIEAQATLLALDAGRPRGGITGRATVSWKGFDLAAIGRVLAPMPDVDTHTGPVDGRIEATLLPGRDIDATLTARIPALRYGTRGEAPQIATHTDVTELISWRQATGRLELKPGSVAKFAGAEIQITGTVDLPAGPIDMLLRFDGEMSRFPALFPSSMSGQNLKGTLRTNWSLKGPTLDEVAVSGTAELQAPFIYRTTADDGTVTEYVVPHPGFFNLTVRGTWDGARRARRAEEEPGRAWASLDGLNLDLSLESPWVRSPSVDIKQIAGLVQLREQTAVLKRLEFVLNGGRVSCDGGVAFDAEDPSWTFRTRVDDPPVAYSHGFSGLAALVNPGLFSTEKGQVEAAMGWDVSLRGRGFDAAAVSKTLQGEGTLSLKRGVLAGSPMLSQLYGALKLTGAARYEFSGMDQKFRIDAGKVLNEWSNWQGAKDADFTISGETAFDGTLNQTIRVTGDAEARWGKTTAKVVKVLNDAGGIPLRGTVAAPKIQIDYEKALEGVVKGLLDDPAVKDKWKDLLEDPFKKKDRK
ncbi:MAG: hypothetical protein HUU15_06955 [Candidatus Brocadiae bacterium]|nr:hypothetical protein [Candidatus Brocadiia bacterium]